MSQHLRVSPFSMLTLGLLLLAFPGFTQSLVKGKVTSSTDQSALPGINILIKGSTTGTSTNADGTFEIQAGEEAVLVISGIGYLTQEVPVRRHSQVNVQLSD